MRGSNFAGGMRRRLPVPPLTCVELGPANPRWETGRRCYEVKRSRMRVFLTVVMIAAGLAMAVPQSASAANGCGRYRHWNGWRCVWNGPRYYGPAFGFYVGP